MDTNTTTMSTLPTGTISHGTMLARHLVPRFLSALRAVNPALADALDQDMPASYESEAMDYWLSEVLWDVMNDHCPEGHYFGAHPGDGSDYGVWAVEDAD